LLNQTPRRWSYHEVVPVLRQTVADTLHDEVRHGRFFDRRAGISRHTAQRQLREQRQARRDQGESLPSVWSSMRLGGPLDGLELDIKAGAIRLTLLSGDCGEYQREERPVFRGYM